MKTIEYTVDGDVYTTNDHKLTPNQIITNAGLDPVSFYLIQVKEDGQVSYQNEPEKEITIHKDAKFLARRCGDTTVS